MPSKLVSDAVDWIRGDDAFLFKPIPEDLKKKHITEIMGKHPFHPYREDLPKGHVCEAKNEAFFRCMSARPAEEVLHMKHVNCYHPFKTDLMKCFADEERARKRAAAAGDASNSQ